MRAVEAEAGRVVGERPAREAVGAIVAPAAVAAPRGDMFGDEACLVLAMARLAAGVVEGEAAPLVAVGAGEGRPRARTPVRVQREAQAAMRLVEPLHAGDRAGGTEVLAMAPLAAVGRGQRAVHGRGVARGHLAPHVAMAGDAPATCVGCHEKDDTHRGTMGADCGSCHGTTRWGDATFAHEAFPLDHGREGRIPCRTCHEDPANYTSYTCYNCHEHSRERVARDHRGEVRRANLDDCLACHRGGSKHGGDERDSH